MWCDERKPPRWVRGLLAAARWLAFSSILAGLVGSAAAEEQTLGPNLKVSGKASFLIDARASGDSFEVHATLGDEIGRPLPAAEVRIRAVSADGAATLRRCGDSRGEAGGELLLNTDKLGRLCVNVAGLAKGNVEFGFQDPRGYFERTTRFVSLPESVSASFELGFDPPLNKLSLDRPVQELGLVARTRSGTAAPSAAELSVSLVTDGPEQELGRVALDGLGEVHRLAVVSSSFGHPGPARLIARLRSHDGHELAEARNAVLLNATVALSVANGAAVEPGASLQVHAASALGPVPAGVVEARSRGFSIAAARVQDGVATLHLPTVTLTNSVTLEYVGAGPGWLSGPAVELRVLAPAPGYARYALWIMAAALAALAVVLGWRRPPRPRPLEKREAPRVQASVEVLEVFAAADGYRGTVQDAHDGTAVCPALITLVGPGPSRPVLLQLQTSADGGFRIAGGAFPPDALVEVTAPWHATLTAPLPNPGLLKLSLVSRRRAMIERLVRWAERHGKPWTRSGGDPTPAQIAVIAAKEAEPDVERWARGLERLAFGPVPPDGASELATGVNDDPKTTRERGID